MSKKSQNIFFGFGLLVLIIMITQLDFGEVWRGLSHAGYWFFAVLGLWIFLYGLNALAWWLILRSQDGGAKHISYWWIYKLTISGFALNYATPGGLMGGEPYRIMELAPVVGTERASSSVILYAMTHIFSHFWFWLISIFLFVFTQHVSVFMAVMLTLVGAFCILCIWFFATGYKAGFANKLLHWLRHVPLVKKWSVPFVEKHKSQLDTIDRQIAALHAQNRKTFYCALLLELSCRFASATEIFFILLVLMPSVNYVQCILILAFTSLFANMLFFMPLQLGGREGGFLMSVSGLGLGSSAGIFVALIVRLRELAWTGIGLLLIKLDKKKT